MVEWIKKRLNKPNVELKSITEELLDELVSKDSGNQYGMDNMSAILIKFNTSKSNIWSSSHQSILSSQNVTAFITNNPQQQVNSLLIRSSNFNGSSDRKYNAFFNNNTNRFY